MECSGNPQVWKFTHKGLNVFDLTHWLLKASVITYLHSSFHQSLQFFQSHVYLTCISWAHDGNTMKFMLTSTRTKRSKHGQVYGKMLQYTKTIISLVKCLKLVANFCLHWFFCGVFYCYVRYLNILSQRCYMYVKIYTKK